MQIVLISATLILTVSVPAVQSETRCKIPESPERGSVLLVGEPTVGSLALYLCDEGLTVFGTSTIKCLSTGEWTFDPPKCIQSCRVNDIRNGKIGRYERVRHSSGYRLEFSKLPIGQIVKHNETVTLKCDSGFIPANLYEYPDRDSEQITCTDGLWNATIVCREKPCLGHPPTAENASPVIGNRSHGAFIWYRCDDDFFRKKTGGVFCDHGTWKGNTPICTDTRCNTNQLNFEGLLKPKVPFVKTRTFFKINCGTGYKKAVTKEKIRCVNGQWDTKKNPCKKETCDDDPPSVANGRPLQFTREDGSSVQYECDEHFHLVGTSEVRCEAGKWEGQIPFCQESMRHVITSVENSTGQGIAPGLLNVSSSPNPFDPCFCTYDFDALTAAATVKGKRLGPGERVEKDEIVTFSCLYPGSLLQWENGMIIYGTANLICRCENLTQRELPKCLGLQAGSSAFLYNDKMKILPGGRVEVINKEPFEITCMNLWSQPNWYPHSEGFSVIKDSESTVRKNGYYTATMHIPVVDNKNKGRYECFFTYNSRNFTPSVLELQIADPNRLCPEFQEEGISVSYEMGRRVNSKALFSCTNQGQQLIGKATLTCQGNGRWSDTPPHCEDVKCKKLKEEDMLEIHYTNDQEIGSFAIFHCFFPAKRSGVSFTRCLENGSWADPAPTCINYVNCPKFEESMDLEVSYSDGFRVGSVASFHCQPPKKLLGNSNATCRFNGTWSQPFPVCEGVPGCRLSKNVESHLLIEPVREYYRSGDLILLSCPPGQKLTPDVEKVVCLGKTWSDELPDCTEIP